MDTLFPLHQNTPFYSASRGDPRPLKDVFIVLKSEGFYRGYFNCLHRFEHSIDITTGVFQVDVERH